MVIRPTHRSDHQHRYEAPGGPWDLPPLDVLLSEAAGLDTNAAPVIVDAATGSRVRVDDVALAAASWLAANGIRAGDAVVWQLPNSVEAVALYRGCWKLGALAVPVHHLASDAARDAIAAAVSARLVVTDQHPVALLDAGGPTSGPELEHGRHVPVGEAAAVLFTAGSSGTPKGVIHTHRTLGYKARLMPQVHGLTPDDTVLMPAPLAHISGLLNGVLVPQVAGMRCVLMAKWDPATALELIEREQVTFMVGPPTFFIGLMNDPSFSRSRVRSLRLISTGGAGVTPAFVERAATELGARVKRSYGSTEAPTVATSTTYDPWVCGRDFDGRAIGAAELRIGEDGELLVRGPEVCAGYLDARHNQEAFAPDGWFRTGDRASISDDGWLTITGRLKNIIIRGGENISVAEVEAVVARHPLVAECAVVGYPDERLGERAALFVVLRHDTSGTDTAAFDLAECRRWCERAGLAKFSWPERVVIIDEMPVLAAGKIDRSALAARIAQAASAANVQSEA